MQIAYWLSCLLVVLAVLRLIAVRIRVETALRQEKQAAAAPLSVLDAAFLAGGPPRVADVLLTGMHRDGRVVVSSLGQVTLTSRAVVRPLENAVVDIFGVRRSAGLATLRGELMRHRDVQALGNRLAAQGLLVRPALEQRWRHARGHVGLALMPFALFSFIHGFSDEGGRQWAHPVWLMLGTAVTAVVLMRVLGPPRGRLTRLGKAELDRLTRRNPWAVPGGAPDLALLGMVALLGVGEVTDPVLQELLTDREMAQQSASASASGGGGGCSTGVSVWCATSDTGGTTGCGGSVGSGGDSGGGDGGSGGDGGGCGGGCGGCGG